MKLTNLQIEWRKIADQLGLVIENNYTIQTNDGDEIVIEVLLRNFGAKNGMCLITNFSVVGSHLDELNERGFGFSTLSDPEDNDKIDFQSTIEMLKDWGWSGKTDKPRWLND